MNESYTRSEKEESSSEQGFDNLSQSFKSPSQNKQNVMFEQLYMINALEYQAHGCKGHVPESGV